MENIISFETRSALEQVSQTIKKSKDFLRLPEILNKLLDKTTTKEDLVRIVQLLEKLVEEMAESNPEESAMGIALLGLYYSVPMGVPKDPKKGVEYYTRAVQQGNAYAHVWLASCFANGTVVQQDRKKAFELCSYAEKQGLALAQNNLGLYCVLGIGVAPDAQRGFKLIGLAAKQGLARAHNNLGYHYANGIGTDQNGKLAFEHYTLAVSQNFMVAHRGLGDLYLQGIGVRKNKKRAAHHYTLAANDGDGTSLAQLGELYQKGLGVPKDEKRAFENFVLAAQKSEPYGLNSVGFFYFSGLNVSKDTKKAVEYFSLGTAARDGSAPLNLGHCYHKGIGVSKDPARALLLCLEAVGRGNEAAVNKVYEIHSEFSSFSASLHSSTKKFIEHLNSLIDSDPAVAFEKAFEYFDKLKHQDFSALTFVAFRYQMGLLGVQQNIEEAIRLYSQALEKGASCYWDLYLCHRMLEQKERLDLKILSEFYKDLQTASKDKENRKATNVLAYLHENNATALPGRSLFFAEQCYDLIHSNVTFEIDVSDAREHATEKAKSLKPLHKLKKDIQETTQILPGIASIIVEYACDEDMRERLKNA